ncbi:MAG: MvaI/BcnI restriction endonuclease family protein [Muribaculaceae bacterium]|nr:MvaI/BcnI restriction endonuclease family protein [Muribaculaceae bacterium]
MSNKDKIIEAFKKVKALKWVKSHRSNNTGIGKTFEDVIGVVENNLDEPDLFGFEIKSHRAESQSFVTLFTKKPSHPSRGANACLKNKFGTNYPNSQLKELHTSIFANRYNTYKDKYSFRLVHKTEERRVYIEVYTLADHKLLDNTVYYAYEDIEAALKNKLHNLFYVKAQQKQDSDKTELFFFDSAEIYTDPSLERFLKLLDKGKIMYDIRMGAYQSGKKIGKPHDHGSGFRIRETDFKELYANHETID